MIKGREKGEKIKQEKERASAKSKTSLS